MTISDDVRAADSIAKIADEMAHYDWVMPPPIEIWSQRLRALRSLPELLPCPKCGNGRISVKDLPCACNFCSYVMDHSCPFCGEEPDWKRPIENGPRIVGCINSACCMRQLGYVSEEIWNRRALPSLAELERDAGRLFDPKRLPPPDADGFFEHPDIRAIFGKNEPSMDEVVFTLLARGWQAEYVSGNELVDEETGEYTAIGWSPTLPQNAGLKAVYESHTDGWRLVSVYDSEDGPMALFARPARANEAKPKNDAFDTLPDDYETGDY